MIKSVSLLGLAVIILLTGCTQEYQLERMYYQANKKYTRVLQNPSNTYQIDEVIADFNEIIKTNPDWVGVVNVKYSIAHLYFLKKDFKKAREKFNQIISDYPSNSAVCFQARCLIGVCYEREDKWDKALPIFEKIIKEYPLSPVAMELIYHISDYYQYHKKYDDAKKVLRDAIITYEDIMNKYPSAEKVVIICEDFIVKTYEKLQDEEGVINTLQKIVVKYPQTNRGADALYRLAKIYENKKRPKEAIDFYKQFIQDYPEHNLVSVAKTKINSLQLALPKK